MTFRLDDLDVEVAGVDPHRSYLSLSTGFDGTASTEAHIATVREIRRRYDRGETQKALGLAFGVHRGTIGKIVRREKWSHVI